MKTLFRNLCLFACLLLRVCGECAYGEVADAASKEEALLRRLCLVMQEELNPYLPKDGLQQVVVKRVSEKAFEKIDAVFPLQEKWVYIERGKNDVFTVYLNEATDSAPAQGRQQAQRRAEELSYALGRALLAPVVRAYWKKQEGQPVPPVYDAKKQVNPSFVLACHLAAACRSRITKTPCSLHDYVRELAERDPRLQQAAEEICAHYPADVQALRQMLGYEAFWIQAREETARYLSPEGEDLLLMVPLLEEAETNDDIPPEQREYVQQKYPVEGLEATEDDVPGAGDMMSRVHRQVTQRKTISLACRMLEWQDQEKKSGPQELRKDSKEYKERERLLRDLSDLLCEELVKAVRRLCYVTAAMKDQESALKYEEAYYACWADVDALAAPLLEIGAEYFHDMEWGLNSRNGAAVRRESLILASYHVRFDDHRFEWFGFEHTQEYNARTDNMTSPAYLMLSAIVAEEKRRSIERTLIHEQEK